MNKTELTNSYAKQISEVFISIYVDINTITEGLENGIKDANHLCDYSQLVWEVAERRCMDCIDSKEFAISYVSGNLQFCVNAYNTNVANTEEIDIQELAFWGLYSMFIKNNKITIAKAQKLLNEYWDKVDELEMEETE